MFLFAIALGNAQTITVTTPASGATIVAGSTQLIEWNVSSGTLDSVYLSAYDGTELVQISDTILNTGSYLWQVPDNLRETNGGTIAVASPDQSISGFTPFNLIFEGLPKSLSVLTPDTGAVFTIGASEQITWNSTGSIENVLIRLLHNGQTTTLANSAPNTGSFDWTVSDVNCTSCEILLRDASDNTISTTSGEFAIGKVINVTTPELNSTYSATNPVDINWETFGFTSDVTLSYSIDNQTTWIEIGTGISQSPYNWTPPVVQFFESNCYVRAESEDGSNIIGYSPKFRLTIPDGITITEPNGGETFDFNELQTIRWTTNGSVPTVNVMSSSDLGVTWDTIAKAATNNGSFNWRTYAEGQVMIKVESATNADLFDLTDDAFTVPAVAHSIAITSPKKFPKSEWMEGQENAIAFTTSGYIPEVGLSYSVDNGQNYVSIEDAFAVNSTTSQYSWIIPHGINNADTKIKVNETIGVEEASVTVSITDSMLTTITYPNGGEVFQGLDTIDVTWTEEGLMHATEFYYSLDSGATWVYLHHNQLFDQASSFEFVLPNIASTQVLLRAVVQGFLEEYTDATFTIVPSDKSLTITDPNGGSKGIYGGYQVGFESEGISHINMYMSIDSGSTWFKFGSNKAIDDILPSWNPNVNTTGALVRIEDASDTTVFDISDSLITVYGYSELEVLTPNGGEVLVSDSTYEIAIEYTAGTINPLPYLVRLEYSSDGGTSWKSVEQNFKISNDEGSVLAEESGVFTFDWTVPANVASNNCLIRVYDFYSDDLPYYVQDWSDDAFTISTTKEIEVATFPFGMIIGGETLSIEWDTEGAIDEVDILFTLDAGETWSVVVEGASNNGLYNWLVTDQLHGDLVFRIQDSAENEVFGLSGPKVITYNPPSFEITYPNGGETFIGGETRTITWNWNGDTNDQWVAYYSTDGGASWNFINDGGFDGVNDNSEGSSIWNLPSTVVDVENCFIRVISGLYGDTSDVAFTIQGNTEELTLLTPNGGEELIAGTSFEITWETVDVGFKTQAFEDVVLSYLDGQEYIVIDTIANTGSYFWTVPHLQTQSAKVKVQFEGSFVSDESNSPFSISFPVGISMPSLSDDLVVFPNPTNGDVVQLNRSIASVEIYDAAGQIVKSFISTSILNIKGLQTGVYFIKSEANVIRLVKY